MRITSPLSQQIREIMETIIAAENIIIDEHAKEYLLMISGDSIRIMINFLEKIYILGENVDLDLCKKVCSSISFQEFELYLACVLENKLQAAIAILSKIYDYGYSVIDILDYFFVFIKTTKMIDEETKYKFIPLLCKYITIFHNIHEDSIELALLTNNLCHVIANKKLT